jgi:hypothetical protein
MILLRVKLSSVIYFTVKKWFGENEIKQSRNPLSPRRAKRVSIRNWHKAHSICYFRF